MYILQYLAARSSSPLSLLISLVTIIYTIILRLSSFPVANKTTRSLRNVRYSPSFDIPTLVR